MTTAAAVGPQTFGLVVLFHLGGGPAHSTPALSGIVLDCKGINFVDSQGSAKLNEIADLADDAAVTLRLARVKPAVAETLSRDGVLERIGADRVHGNVH